MNITRDIYFNPDERYISETAILTNTGSVPLVNISMMWHAQLSAAATKRSALFVAGEEDYQSYSTLLNQGSSTNARVLVQTKSIHHNFTLLMGSLDTDARAWVIPASSWRTPSNPANRPYSPNWLLSDVDQATPINKNTQLDYKDQAVIGVASKKQITLAVGQSVTFKVFHAFHPSEVEAAFNTIVNGCPGNQIRDFCGVCNGTCTSMYLIVRMIQIAFNFFFHDQNSERNYVY
jgi:hypothetical protein